MTLNDAGPLGFALIGLLLGMRHATDPDHVIAVTTFVSRERNLGGAVRIGLIWGIGHSATVLVVGAGIIFLKIAIPARLGLAMEYAVAIVLIGLGARAARNLLHRLLARIGVPPDRKAPNPALVHSHQHAHGSLIHRHPHLHAHPDLHSAGRAHTDHRLPSNNLAVRRPHVKSFGVGLVHGLAGSAAIALLVLNAIPSPGWAMLYLALFGVGTILGMGLITAMIGAPIAWTAARMHEWQHGIALGAGLLSFGFGVFLAWQIGIKGHLFGALPSWTPQ
jgi:high-affinity nickel-transport protein